MLNVLFGSVFDATAVDPMDAWYFILCIAIALGIGVYIAFMHSIVGHASKSFLTTLALLPAIVAVIIMMVDGNLGTGIAVAGAFSLVRFRSVPGTAREIASIFLAMGAGLIVGMGYIGYALIFSAILGGMMVLFERTGIGAHGSGAERTLRITIPEALDYDGEFDDLFAVYTANHQLVSVKTTNMGSLFKLTYTITMLDPKKEKAFIDEIRCRNGNLEISIGQQEVVTYEL